MILARREVAKMSGEGILLPVLSTNVTLYSLFSHLATMNPKCVLLVQRIAKYDRIQQNSEQEGFVRKTFRFFQIFSNNFEK